MSEQDYRYYREYWVGDSRDGSLVNGEGYHYYKMTSGGKIIEAYEYYEQEDGSESSTYLPEMCNVEWIADLGFEDMEILDPIAESAFEHVKAMSK
jgi:hypothetical protein